VLAALAALIPLLAIGLKEPAATAATPTQSPQARDALVSAAGHSGFWMLNVGFALAVSSWPFWQLTSRPS
jgi:hypothetical protein